MPVVYKEYKDLDLDFSPHPITGDLNVITGIDAVKRSLKNIILTTIYEKPFNINFGSRVTHLLFESVDPLTKYVLRDEIQSAISVNEKRAKVINIDTQFVEDENRYEVSILFYVENLTQEFELTVFLERVR